MLKYCRIKQPGGDHMCAGIQPGTLHKMNLLHRLGQSPWLGKPIFPNVSWLPDHKDIGHVPPDSLQQSHTHNLLWLRSSPKGQCFCHEIAFAALLPWAKKLSDH